MQPLVLVVDDEAANRKALERILVREGYTVAHAEDGPAALESIRLSPPRGDAHRSEDAGHVRP